MSENKKIKRETKQTHMNQFIRTHIVDNEHNNLKIKLFNKDMCLAFKKYKRCKDTIIIRTKTDEPMIGKVGIITTESIGFKRDNACNVWIYFVDMTSVYSYNEDSKNDI